MAKFILLICYIFLSLNIEAKEKPYKTITIDNNNHVFNSTKIYYLDTIVHVGLMELKIDSVIISIRPLIDPYYLDNDYQAYIDSKGNQFIIWIQEKSQDDAIQILSHELIHLRQYYYEELIIDGINVFWLGEEFDVDFMDYEDRPWENEAYAEQNYLKNKIISIIY